MKYDESFHGTVLESTMQSPSWYRPRWTNHINDFNGIAQGNEYAHDYAYGWPYQCLRTDFTVVAGADHLSDVSWGIPISTGVSNIFDINHSEPVVLPLRPIWSALAIDTLFWSSIIGAVFMAFTRLHRWRRQIISEDKSVAKEFWRSCLRPGNCLIVCCLAGIACNYLIGICLVLWPPVTRSYSIQDDHMNRSVLSEDLHWAQDQYIELPTELKENHFEYPGISTFDYYIITLYPYYDTENRETIHEGVAEYARIGFPARSLEGGDYGRPAYSILLEGGGDTGRLIDFIPLRPSMPGFLINTVLYGGFTYVFVFLIPMHVGRRRIKSAIQRGECVNCGYDLRELTSKECPECGTRVPQSQIDETQ